MKKQLFLMGLLLSALTATAQNASLKGVFLKDAMGRKSNTIFIAQNENGRLVPKTSAALRSRSKHYPKHGDNR